MPFTHKITPHRVRKRDTTYWVVRTPRDLRKDGEPVRRFFASKSAAEDHAAVLEAARHSIAGQFHALSPATQAALLRIAARFGNDGERIESLLDFALKHQPPSAGKSVPLAVEEFLRAKEADGVSPHHLRNYRATLRDLAQSFTGQCSELTSGALDDWLRSIDVSLRTRKNKRADLLTFLASIRERGYTRAEFKLTKPEVPPREITVLKPAELEKLLRHGEAQLSAALKRKDGGRLAQAYRQAIAFLVLGAFAGLRSEEIKRLRWEDVHFEHSEIEVRVTATKRTRRTFPRNVTILPVLRAWLDLVKQKEGPVINPTTCQVVGGWSVKAIGREMHNERRHSFASYRCAITGDESAVASQLGHSVSMMRQNYSSPKFKQWAEAYFGIYPTQ